MLVENKTKQVVTFRVTSGDEVVGIMEANDGKTATIVNPAIITLVPGNAGQVNVNLGPFLVAANKGVTVKFNLSQMICHPVFARPEAEAQYRKIVLKEQE